MGSATGDSRLTRRVERVRSPVAVQIVSQTTPAGRPDRRAASATFCSKFPAASFTTEPAADMQAADLRGLAACT